MISLDDIHVVHSAMPDKNGRVVPRRIGSFFYDGQRCALIQDHSGLLEDLPHDAEATSMVKRSVANIMNSSHLRVVPASMLPDPHAQKPVPELPEASGSEEGNPAVSQIQTAPIAAGRPASVFEYHRVGMKTPSVLEIRHGIAVLDGNPLDQASTDRLLANVRTGVATMRYRTQRDLAKAEKFMEALAKAEGGHRSTLADSVEFLRQQVSAGLFPQEHYDRIRRELFEDETVPGIGNKRSFREHLESGAAPGTYASIDLNGLKGANDLHGHEAGDHMIRGVGESLRAAVDKTVGSENAKVWRTGGDEFYLHTNHPDHAHQVLRQLRTELESRPPVGGTHPLSVSAGLGPDHLSADKALYGAKTQKLTAIKAAGLNPEDRTVPAQHSMYVHSALPGHEGPVAMGEPSPLKTVKPAELKPPEPTVK